MRGRYLLILIACMVFTSLTNAEWLLKLFGWMFAVAFIIYIATNLTWKTNEQKTTSENKSVQQS